MKPPGGGPAATGTERSPRQATPYVPMAERLILFTRYPVPGLVKTRLIPSLGAEGAARLHRRLSLRAVRLAEGLQTERDVSFEVCVDGAAEPMHHWLGERFRITSQSPGDLGQRLAAAFARTFEEGSAATVIIGSDCPGLTVEILDQAFGQLREHAVVFGPAKDGGYYLVGLRRSLPQLFSGIAWGTGSVLGDSLRILQKLGLTAGSLPMLADIDRPEDLSVWRDLVNAEESALDSVSVIIPALNEAARISATVAAAAASGAREIMVVDGGSGDETQLLARAAGADVLASSPGRARQMNAGASRARGQVLQFVHADTQLPPASAAPVRDCLRRPGVVAGAFRFAVAEAFAGRRLLEWSTNLRSRWRQMPYGDQALFLPRAWFEELGGFADLPMLEDYELVRRLRRCGRVVTLPIAAATSGRRWARLGLLRTTLIHQRVILGYHFGSPVEKLAAWYRRT